MLKAMCVETVFLPLGCSENKIENNILNKQKKLTLDQSIKNIITCKFVHVLILIGFFYYLNVNCIYILKIIVYFFKILITKNL